MAKPSDGTSAAREVREEHSRAGGMYLVNMVYGHYNFL